MKAVVPAPGVLVLGMHRSGTSATAGALARLGFDMGHRLVPAAEDNPKGYFEHAAIVEVNDALFAALDRSWDDVRPLPAQWLSTEAAAAARARAGEAVAALGDAGPWAAKDPRLCRLMPLWLDVFAARGAAPACLFVLRDPREVAASLAARDAMPARQACLLWLRHLLEAEIATRGSARTLLQYADLLRDPRKAMGAALGDVGVRPPVGIAKSGLEAFIDRGDRHHVASGPVEGDEWMALADRVHAHLAVHGLDGDLASVHSEFDELESRDRQWIETSGEQTRATARARGVGAGVRMDLERRLADTDAALAQAQALCARRDDELAAMAAQLARTEHAVTELEALSLQRLGELEAAATLLRDTQVALADASALSISRLAQLDEQRERISVTDEALRASEALSLERLDEVGRLTARLQATDEALREATALALARTAEARAAQTALDDATRLAVARLEEVEGLGSQLVATSTALREAERLAQARQDELVSLDERLRATAAALADAQALAQARQDELVSLDERLRATAAALADAQALAQARQQEVAALDKRLRATAAGLADAQELAQGRQEQLAALDERLRATETGLAAAQRLAIERQAMVEALSTRLAATETGLHLAEGLAVERLEALRTITAAHEELATAARLAAERNATLESDLDAQARRAEAAEVEVRRIQSMRWWRAHVRLRRWLRRGPP